MHAIIEKSIDKSAFWHYAVEQVAYIKHDKEKDNEQRDTGFYKTISRKVYRSQHEGRLQVEIDYQEIEINIGLFRATSIWSGKNIYHFKTAPYTPGIILGPVT